MKRFGLCFALSVVLISGIHPARGQVAPSLEGETLTSLDLETQHRCTPEGTTLVSFRATGFASGPYPGTFLETGRLAIGPQTAAGGSVVSVDASFWIDSPAGQVIGKKHLAAEVAGLGSCRAGEVGAIVDEMCRRSFSNAAGGRADTLTATARLAYEAVITTDTGSFVDGGESPLLLTANEVTCRRADGGYVGGFAGRSLEESFSSHSVLLVATPGRAGGGGRIRYGAEDVTFGFNATGGERGPKGYCTVVDHSFDTRVKCLTVSSYAQAGNSAGFTGLASVDGEETGYRVVVQDNGEPGSNRDIFIIHTQSGYHAGGFVTHGNVRVHPEPHGRSHGPDAALMRPAQAPRW